MDVNAFSREERWLTMSDDDKNGRVPDLPDDAHFSDEELESALAQFEREFNDDSDAVAKVTSKAEADSDAFAADGDDIASSGNAAADDGDSVAKGAERALSFDDELEGLIGNRAKAAIISTGLAAADLLAAFCQMADISAHCLADERGAVAILHNLDGDAPENAARDLTQMITGMPVVLCVNRAAKLTATLYMAGEPGREFAPPLVLSSTPAAVEDLMLGVSTIDDLRDQGEHLIDTADFDHDKAMQVISDHTKFGRGGSTIE